MRPGGRKSEAENAEPGVALRILKTTGKAALCGAGAGFLGAMIGWGGGPDSRWELAILWGFVGALIGLAYALWIEYPTPVGWLITVSGVVFAYFVKGPVFLAWILGAAAAFGMLSFTYKAVNEHLANQRRMIELLSEFGARGHFSNQRRILDLLAKIANGPHDS
jgi:hypothetical protein